jgi:hypothetical protein
MSQVMSYPLKNTLGFLMYFFKVLYFFYDVIIFLSEVSSY